VSGAGSRDAERDFNRLYEEQQRAVHAYLLGRTGDREVARDLLQEVFLRAWRRADSWRGLSPERQRAWVFAVARNLVIDAHRVRVTADAAQAALERSAPAAAPAAEGPEARAELGERIAALDRAIRRLPEKLRIVLSLHVVGGLTSAQVGEALGEPAGTVRYQLSQARRQLAAALGVEP
jgi:RNA polymerase sigma-70 factor (ECF subfamily)